MDVEILALCDAASVQGGKMSILGVFNLFNAPSAPLIAPPCSLAVRMRFERDEEGPKNLQLTLVDADGHSILPVVNSSVAVRIPPDERCAIVQMVVSIPQLVLQQFGEYAVDLAVDGRVQKSIPLYARQQTPAPT
jgi:Family of unknown function (DUF6941)